MSSPQAHLPIKVTINGVYLGEALSVDFTTVNGFGKCQELEVKLPQEYGPSLPSVWWAVHREAIMKSFAIPCILLEERENQVSFPVSVYGPGFSASVLASNSDGQKTGRLKLFSYAVILHQDSDYNDETEVIVQPTTVLAASAEDAKFKAIRAIPEEHAGDTDRLEIIVRAF